MIASNSMKCPEYKPFYAKEIVERQQDETRTGVCPKCHKPVKILGWAVHSNNTRHIQARCEEHGVVFLAQTRGNIFLADSAEGVKRRKYKAQSDLGVWVIS